MDLLTRLRAFGMVPPRALVIRVGEEHAVVRRHPYIIGTVEQLAFIILDQNSHLSIRGDGPQFILLIRAGDQVALWVEIHAVSAAAGLLERRESAIRAPF